MNETPQKQFDTSFKSFIKMTSISLLFSIAGLLLSQRFEAPERLIRFFNLATIISIVGCATWILLIIIGVIMYIKKKKTSHEV